MYKAFLSFGQQKGYLSMV